jgi:hypothetical protein
MAYDRGFILFFEGATVVDSALCVRLANAAWFARMRGAALTELLQNQCLVATVGYVMTASLAWRDASRRGPRRCSRLLIRAPCAEAS